MLTWQSIGLSLCGRQIKAAFWGFDGPKILLSGAHHANEWVTSVILYRFITECRGRARFCVVPEVNPDGVALVTGNGTKEEYAAARRIGERYPEIPFPFGWKANLRGVDLNLNYPTGWREAVKIKAAKGIAAPAPRDFPGPCPLSEPETRALAALTRRFDPDMVIAFHTQGGEIYYEYQGSAPGKSKEIAAKMADASGYLATAVEYGSSFAGYKDWFIDKFRRPGFTVEAGFGENPLPAWQLEDMYKSCFSIIESAVDNCM